MILAFIQVTEKIPSEAENIVSVTDSPEFVSTENSSQDKTLDTDLQTQNIEEDSFEMKYKKLLKQIEKERFERELIAGSR